MQTITIDEIEESSSFKTSPAAYHDGMIAVLTNKKKFCRMNELERCIEKGIIRESDIYLMKTLYEYQFMTKYVLTAFIKKNRHIPDEHKRSNYKTALSKLVKLGLVFRYYLSWENEGQTCHSPCFYCLSQLGYDYIAKNYASIRNHAPNFLYPASFSPLDMIRSVIFNQFHSQMLYIHEDNLLNFYTNLKIKAGKMHSTLKGVYCIKAPALPKKRAFIVAIPVRNDPEWKKSLQNDLLCSEAYGNKENALFHTPVYILICENVAHAREINHFLHTSNAFAQVPALFSIDRSVLSGDMLGKLFIIQEHEENSYDLILQELQLT